MKFTGESVKKIAILSLVVLVLQIILTKVYSLFGYTTSQVFGIIPYVPNAQTAVGSQTIGNSIIGYISGIYPLNIPFQGYVAMYIGAFILLALGYMAYDKISLFKAKNSMQMIWAVLLYGTIILYAFLMLTKLGDVATLGVPLAIGLALNYAILGFATTKIAEMFPIVRI